MTPDQGGLVNQGPPDETVIPTPDRRLRVFVSSTLGELAEERRAVSRAISALRLSPVMFELGARPYPPREVYQQYLAQSDVFIGLYWQRYGQLAPGVQAIGSPRAPECSWASWMCCAAPGPWRPEPPAVPAEVEDLVEQEPERPLADPPGTWQEHWFDHRQLLRLYHSDEHCAIYVDSGVRRAEVRWLPQFINVTWQYSKATYGDGFGPDPRIYSIHHAGRHGGGHAGYYVSPVHDFHNVSDCGLDTWRESNALARELPAHEIGHSVESASNGVHGSPAYEIWGDSKWAEFYIYDLYTALGMDREAKGVYRRFTGNTDDFPRRGTRWFRDWFYPLWRDCGQAEVMNRFFQQLAQHFPRDSSGTYTRRMNWGEYIHFTSGAAAADMSGQAARAFGWPPEWAGQLEHARQQFPSITY